MGTFFDKVFVEPLRGFFERIVEFLPNLLSSLIVLALGFLAGWLLRQGIEKLLQMIKTDHFCERAGISQALEKGGIKDTPTGLISRAFYYLVIFIFVIMALYTLKIPAIANLLEKFFLYLPNLFVAIILIIIGYILSNFFERAVLIASVNAGIQYSGFLGKGVKTAIILLTFTMALEQLGIGKETVVIAFAILFGGVVFGFSLAFGLAGKEIARDYLEKRFREKKEGDKDELKHL
ncbi:MAG: hypothetical protein D6726_07530 [Nitrospirae bacterium]|nr:MAG: hypothetical protein D6726_07530 [Nitrospirota bacterium]